MTWQHFARSEFACKGHDCCGGQLLPDCSSDYLFDSAFMNANCGGYSLARDSVLSGSANPLSEFCCELRRTPITSLRCSGSPNAIARFIASVVINTFKRCTSWAISHIGDEVAHVMPSFTDDDSSAAVARIVRFKRSAVAAFHHVLPAVIKRVLFAAMAVVRMLATRSDVFPMSFNLKRIAVAAPSKPVCFTPPSRLALFLTSGDRAFVSHGHYINRHGC